LFISEPPIVGRLDLALGPRFTVGIGVGAVIRAIADSPRTRVGFVLMRASNKEAFAASRMPVAMRKYQLVATESPHPSIDL